MTRTFCCAGFLIALAGGLSGCAEAYVVQDTKDMKIVAVPMTGWFPTDYRSVALDYIRETDHNFKESDIIPNESGPKVVGKQTETAQIGRPGDTATISETSNAKEYRLAYRKSQPGSIGVMSNGMPAPGMAARDRNGRPIANSGVVQTGVVSGVPTAPSIPGTTVGSGSGPMMPGGNPPVLNVGSGTGNVRNSQPPAQPWIDPSINH